MMMPTSGNLDCRPTPPPALHNPGIIFAHCELPVLFGPFVSDATLFGSSFLAFDAAGNLYVDCPGQAAVLKVTPGGTVSTFLNNNGLINTQGLAFDAAGNFYVADANNFIVKMTP